MEPEAMRRLAAVLLAILASIAAVLLGVWWAPFAIAVVVGITSRRARTAVPAGAILGLASWAVPLAWAHLQFGLRPTAESLAAIMGFSQPAIPVVLTCVVGLLLGLSGAWLGSAARAVAAGQPATSR
jgi:hypothetical protein